MRIRAADSGLPDMHADRNLEAAADWVGDAAEGAAASKGLAASYKKWQALQSANIIREAEEVQLQHLAAEEAAAARAKARHMAADEEAARATSVGAEEARKKGCR